MLEALHHLWEILKDQGTVNALTAIALIYAGLKTTKKTLTNQLYTGSQPTSQKNSLHQ